MENDCEVLGDAVPTRISLAVWCLAEAGGDRPIMMRRG